MTYLMAKDVLAWLFTIRSLLANLYNQKTLDRPADGQAGFFSASDDFFLFA